jgi:DNA topoisomerase-1
VTLEKDKEKIKARIKSATTKQDTIGKCPKCGKDMVVRMSRRGKRFAACTGYPACKNTYSVPQLGGIEPTGKPCSECGAPVIKVITKGKKPWRLCLNFECPSKNNK